MNRALALALLAAAAPQAVAEPVRAPPLPSAGSPRVTNVSEAPVVAVAAATADTQTRTLDIAVNKTSMIEFETDVDDIIIANPAIANVTARDRRRIAVMGIAPGASNILFLDKSGRKICVLEVSVTDGVAGLEQLRGMIRRYVPDARVNVEGVNGRVILSGNVPSLMASDRVQTLARQFARDDASVLNMMSIDGKEQVMLKVRIVEMQRTLVKQLGINLSGNTSFGELSPSGTSWANNQSYSISNTFGVAGTALGGIAAALGWQNLVGSVQQSAAGVNISALERVGLIRTLAEPNLTAISGESARFLAGGEFPVPVAQDDNQIAITFKPFGVGLGFTPVVLSEGRISLQVSTEVSELTTTGGFQGQSVAGVDPTTGEPVYASSLTIPALKVRRAETTVELPSGGSLVIAGLIQEQTRQSLDGVPGAKDIPVLGALFRSRDFQNDETELVVLVTPYLVDPTDPNRLRDPASGYVTATDSRTIFFGKLNHVYRVKGSAADKAAPPRGDAGFIID